MVRSLCDVRGAGHPGVAPTRRGVVGAALLAWLPTARASHEVMPWVPGRPAPALRLRDLDGREWTQADLRGRVTVLNFWATWCEPCRAELPSLSALARQHGPQRLQVLGVNYRETESKIRRFMDSTPIGFPVLLDADGSAAREWTRRIFPTTVVVDSRGLPRVVVTGEYDWASADAQALLSPYLRGQSG